MSDDKQLYDLFKANKAEFANNGFSKRVMRRLPKRNSLLPQIIITLCLISGMVLTFWLQGDSSLYKGIQEMIVSLSYAQVPSFTAINDYIIVLLLIGSISFGLLYSYDKE